MVIIVKNVQYVKDSILRLVLIVMVYTINYAINAKVTIKRAVMYAPAIIHGYVKSAMGTIINCVPNAKEQV